MIRLTQIDEDLSIYKDNIVVLLGIDHSTDYILDLLEQNDIKADYICENDESKLTVALEKYKFITPNELSRIFKEKNHDKDFVIQFTSTLISKDFEEKLRSFGFNTIIPYIEAVYVLIYKIKSNLIKNNPIIKSNFHDYDDQGGTTIDLQFRSNEFIINNQTFKQLLFVCMMEKSGDHTLMKTLDKNNIDYFFSFHTPETLDKEMLSNLNQTIKITNAVRDPLSVYVSKVYERLSAIVATNFICRFDPSAPPPLDNGCDVQKEFDRFYNYNDEDENPVSNFMERLKEHVIDLSQYEFDKEKGYTIIKEGNIEVFVYQLEKMNDVAKEMSDWIGETPFDEWVIGNEASSKWIAKSYKQAQKELKFSKEFFDKCYNNKWIEHFYSKEDIEKFKARWIDQVVE